MPDQQAKQYVLIYAITVAEAIYRAIFVTFTFHVMDDILG